MVVMAGEEGEEAKDGSIQKFIRHHFPMQLFISLLRYYCLLSTIIMFAIASYVTYANLEQRQGETRVATCLNMSLAPITRGNFLHGLFLLFLPKP